MPGILAFRPIADDDVVLFDPGERQHELTEMKLQIGIAEEDELLASLEDASFEGCTVALIAGMMQRDHALILLAQAIDDLTRLVLTAVIDDDDLPILKQGFDTMHRLFNGLGDVIFFIIGWKNDGNSALCYKSHTWISHTRAAPCLGNGGPSPPSIVGRALGSLNACARSIPSAHTSTPAVAAWAQVLSRVGKAPPPSVCPCSSSTTCNDVFDGDAMRWHTPWLRQHQLSAKGAHWHADSWCPARGKENARAADSKTAAAWSSANKGRSLRGRARPRRCQRSTAPESAHRRMDTRRLWVGRHEKPCASSRLVLK